MDIPHAAGGRPVPKRGRIRHHSGHADLRAVTVAWYRNGNLIPGATGSTLVLHSVRWHDQGIYRVAFTDGGGSITSPPTSLTVRYADPGGSLMLVR